MPGMIIKIPTGIQHNILKLCFFSRILCIDATPYAPLGFKTPEHALPFVSEVHIAHSLILTFENILSIRFD
jgi:hypothetical protein